MPGLSNVSLAARAEFEAELPDSLPRNFSSPRRRPASPTAPGEVSEEASGLTARSPTPPNRSLGRRQDPSAVSGQQKCMIKPTMANRARAFQEACRLRWRDPVARTPTCFPRPGQAGHSAAVFSPRACSGRRSPTLYLKVSVGSARPQQTQTRLASTSSGPSRRAITVTSDDGRYNWNELSKGEKAARGTQQTFNFLLVGLGLVGTLTVAYLLYLELLSPSSSTVQFNAAVGRIKSSSECRALLGPSSQIKAYGEPTSNKWARARPLAHSTEVDKYGTTHFRMHFNVEGTQSGVKGVVSVHMTKSRSDDRLEYQVLGLSVKGQETVYLENKAAQRGVKGQAAKMFGVQWR